MKRMLSILLLCSLLWAQAALAEGLPPGAQVLELENTLTIQGTTWPEGQQAPTYAVDTWFYSFLPLPDGAKVLSGDMEYREEYRNPYGCTYQSPESMKRSEAYALCLEPDGSVRWELRLADPQATNSLGVCGLLPDGRILMRFLAYDTTFGPKYFIVGQDGFVESMLDHRKLSEAFTPLSLMLTPAGYLGGNSTVVDDHHDQYFGGWGVSMAEMDHHMTLLDFDLNPIWTLDMTQYIGGAMNIDALALRDGTLLYGSRENLEAPEVKYPERQEYPERDQTFAMRVDAKGGVAWQYAGGAGGASIVNAVETAEGVLLMERIQDVADASRFQNRLIALAAGGEERFTVDLGAEQALAGVKYYGDIAPLGDGFVLEGATGTRGETLLVHIDGEGKLLGTLPLSPDAGGTVYGHSLRVGVDGKTYLYGMIRQPESEENWWGGESKGFYYAELTPESFQ